MDENGRINGIKGTFIINHTTDYSGVSYEVVVPVENTTIAYCTGVNEHQNKVDFKDTQNWGGPLTIAHGPLTVPEGSKITDIKLTSGEVVCL